MNQNNTKTEIQKRAEKIETIYNKYLAKLAILKKKQTEIINQFIKELEQKKIEEIKQSLEQ